MSNADPAMIGASNFERLENDAYDTPPEVTGYLIDADREFTGLGTRPILEPAAGKGSMSVVLQNRLGVPVFSADVKPRARWITRRDFLAAPVMPPTTLHDAALKYDIVTNPPFGDLARPFVDRALNHLRMQREVFGSTGQVAWLLLRNEWNSAGGRVHLFQPGPVISFLGKVVINRRIRWFKPRKGDKGPRHNFSWFGWRCGEPVEERTRYAPHTGRGNG